MFWDVCVLLGYLIINLVIARIVFEAHRKGVAPPKWIKYWIYVSIPWAVSIHTVTAFLYAGLAGRSYFMTAILAPRFLASAFAAGPSLLILLCLLLKKTSGFDAGDKALRKLAQIVAYAMLLNVFFILLELFTAYYSQIPHHTAHFNYMYTGHPETGMMWLNYLMWASAIISVIVAVLLVIPKTRNNLEVLPWLCGGTFFALWAEKGLGMIIAGLVPTPLHEYPSYMPTIPEVTVSLAVYAIGALVLTILYKAGLSLHKPNAA